MSKTHEAKWKERAIVFLTSLQCSAALTQILPADETCPDRWCAGPGNRRLAAMRGKRINISKYDDFARTD